MFSLSTLFKKKPSVSAFRGLRVDMHSHLIPGIDDGSPDVATSLALIRGMQELGYEKIITTPHILTSVYNNNSTGIRAGLATLKEALAEANMTVDLEVAAEYFIDKHLDELIQKDDLLSFGSKRFVLIEMSFVSPSPNLEEAVFALVARGYHPILAHPERYSYLVNKEPAFERLRELGCLMQVNILSLVGYYGKGVQNWALTLMKAGYIDFLGTDLHHHNHLELLGSHQFNRKMVDIIGKYPFQNPQLLA